MSALCVLLLVGWLLGDGTTTVWASDRLVLRNLTVISDREATGVDEDGVHFGGGETVGWDEIESGLLGGGRQDQFERLLRQLGEPLYRIRQRLKVGDFQGLLPYAEQIQALYQHRRGQTAYMVFQGLMWARLSAGQREAAVEPYLRCYDLLSRGDADGSALPGRRRLAYDDLSALCPELTPIWLDAAAAKRAMPGVFQAAGQLPRPLPDGVSLYYATLALAAGDLAEADRVLQGIAGRQPAAAQWLQVARAQRALLQDREEQAAVLLAPLLSDCAESVRPGVLYWLGMSQVRSGDEAVRREGVLHLLYLPALYGREQAELAAAGLYQSVTTLAELGDVAGSAAVRKELLLRYAHTTRAARLRAEAASGEP